LNEKLWGKEWVCGRFKRKVKRKKMNLIKVVNIKEQKL